MRIGQRVVVINEESFYNSETGVIVELANDRYYFVSVQFDGENALNGKRMGFHPVELSLRD